MANAELKTKANKGNVKDFLDAIKDPAQRKDSFAIVKIMQEVTKDKPELWGTSIVGFGHVHLKYASGRELDWMKVGFSPRKQNLTLYVLNGAAEQNNLLKNLGKYKTGKGCLYINQLSDVDINTLKKIIISCCAKYKIN